MLLLYNGEFNKSVDIDTIANIVEAETNRVCVLRILLLQGTDTSGNFTILEQLIEFSKLEGQIFARFNHRDIILVDEDRTRVNNHEYAVKRILFSAVY